ncbi:hypothetical protein ACFL3B_05745 [Gemmatimonadota bacterium]
MTRPSLSTILSCCAAITLGCAGDDEPEVAQSETPEFVAQVAAVAHAITQAPAAVDSILEAHEMTRARFDSLMFEIAMDPGLTEAFEAARR